MFLPGVSVYQSNVILDIESILQIRRQFKGKTGKDLAKSFNFAYYGVLCNHSRKNIPHVKHRKEPYPTNIFIGGVVLFLFQENSMKKPITLSLVAVAVSFSAIGGVSDIKSSGAGRLSQAVDSYTPSSTSPGYQTNDTGSSITWKPTIDLTNASGSLSSSVSGSPSISLTNTTGVNGDVEDTASSSSTGWHTVALTYYRTQYTTRLNKNEYYSSDFERSSLCTIELNGSKILFIPVVSSNLSPITELQTFVYRQADYNSGTKRVVLTSQTGWKNKSAAWVAGFNYSVGTAQCFY